MAISLVQSLSTGATLVQSFAQSISAIENYCSWIADQSDTGNSNLDAILTKCKIDAANWYNSIYPTYLNMPATIVNAGQQIDGDLSTLMSLAQQLQSSDTPQIRQSVAQYAQSLEQTAQGLQTQTSNLAHSLQAFASNVAGDMAGYGNGLNVIKQNIYNLQSILSNLYGQLHSLQNATCPDKKSINACQDQIGGVKVEIIQYEGFLNVFYTGSRLSGEASTAANYLSGFWLYFSNDLGRVTASLQNIQNQPAAILTLDLRQSQQNWNNIKSQLQQMSQQAVL